MDDNLHIACPLICLDSTIKLVLPRAFTPD